MQLCNIVPAALLERLVPDDDKMHLAVAKYVLESPELVKYYRERQLNGDFIILDNEAFETGEGDLATLLEAVQLLDPNEVILPDILNDGKESINATRQGSVDLLASGYKGQFMAVPHGRDIDEYIKHAWNVANVTGVTTIGIQEEVDDLFGLPRAQVARMVQRATGKTIHLLGTREDFSDVKDPWVRGNVRSADTAKLVVFGLAGVDVHPGMKVIPPYPGRAKIGGREGYFKYDTKSTNAIETAKRNMADWGAYARKVD